MWPNPPCVCQQRVKAAGTTWTAGKTGAIHLSPALQTTLHSIPWHHHNINTVTIDKNIHTLHGSSKFRVGETQAGQGKDTLRQVHHACWLILLMSALNMSAKTREAHAPGSEHWSDSQRIRPDTSKEACHADSVSHHKACKHHTALLPLCSCDYSAVMALQTPENPHFGVIGLLQHCAATHCDSSEPHKHAACVSARTAGKPCGPARW